MVKNVKYQEGLKIYNFRAKLKSQVRPTVESDFWRSETKGAFYQKGM